MTTWKYTDATNMVAFRTLENGGIESCLVFVLPPDTVIEPADPLPPVTYSCSPWQIRKALNAQGLRAAAESAVAASTDQALKDGWEFATEFRSDDPFVISMGAVLGKSEEETAQFIQHAATL